MTNSVSVLGMFAPLQGARDTKVSEDTVLASFAGVLAGVNQANARLFVPAPQVEPAASHDALENPDDGTATTDAKKADDSGETVAGASVADAPPAPANTVASSNANAIDSSVAALNPALQEKLSRVISRMRDETGHTVQVTETYRSQSRQDALYAQGRRTDGPVVTWTQHSKHTQGRAVDVTIDGGRASADAYTALQRIANEEGLRTLGSKDPGHLELPSNSGSADQGLSNLRSVPAEARASPGQVPVARLAEIAQVATVARVATVASVTVSSSSGRHKLGSTAVNVVLPEPKAPAVLPQADGADDTTGVTDNTAPMVAEKLVGGDVSIADATGASVGDDPSPTRPDYRPFEISNIDRLSDAVNATRVEDGSQWQASAKGNSKAQRISPSLAGFANERMAQHAHAQAVGGGRFTIGQQPRATNATAQGGANSSVQFSAATPGRSGNDGHSFSSDRQSSYSDATGYSPMTLRSEPTSSFSVADVATEMASTASQRAERIMAAQDAPARPLSQIVMSVDAGNGTTDRIQVALRGSTINATIDAADHHAANAMRSHSDDLVRSLTRDGMEVDSVRVRTSATSAASTPAPTVESSQKPSDSSGNSRFNRDAQWDQQRSQQRSNNERRHQQRDQRGGKES
jgi:uncharacterized protein YcbK (DUF882 family)